MDFLDLRCGFFLAYLLRSRISFYVASWAGISATSLNMCDSSQFTWSFTSWDFFYFTLASSCGLVWREHHCMCPSLYSGMGPVLWSSLGTSWWLLLPGGLHFLGSMGRPYSADRWRCPYTSWYPCRIAWPCMRQSLRWGLALFGACFFPLNAFSVKVLRAVFPVRAWTLFWWWSTVVLLLYLFGAVVELLVLLSWQMAGLWPGAFSGGHRGSGPRCLFLTYCPGSRALTRPLSRPPVLRCTVHQVILRWKGLVSGGLCPLFTVARSYSVRLHGAVTRDPGGRTACPTHLRTNRSPATRQKGYPFS